MKKQIIGGLASILVLTIIFASIQTTEAVSYYDHDGSVDENMTKTMVKPLKGKKDLWGYNVMVCATDYTLGVAAVILKSDMDEKVLGVNKVIKKGDCSYYGAVMKAKDGKTLGAELIERHEALEKYSNSFNDIDTKSKSQHKEAQKEWFFYRSILGGVV